MKKLIIMLFISLVFANKTTTNAICKTPSNVVKTPLMTWEAASLKIKTALDDLQLKIDEEDDEEMIEELNNEKLLYIKKILQKLPKLTVNNNLKKYFSITETYHVVLDNNLDIYFVLPIKITANYNKRKLKIKAISMNANNKVVGIEKTLLKDLEKGKTSMVNIYISWDYEDIGKNANIDHIDLTK